MHAFRETVAKLAAFVHPGVPVAPNAVENCPDPSSPTSVTCELVSTRTFILVAVFLSSASLSGVRTGHLGPLTHRPCSLVA